MRDLASMSQHIDTEPRWNGRNFVASNVFLLTSINFNSRMD